MKAQCEAERCAKLLYDENHCLKEELCSVHQTVAEQCEQLTDMRSALECTRQQNKLREMEITKLKNEVNCLCSKLKEAQNEESKGKSDDDCEEQTHAYKSKLEELERAMYDRRCACEDKDSDDQKKLAQVTEERDCLQRRCDQLSGIEQAYNSLRGQLNDIQNVVAERDRLRVQLLNCACLEDELESLRCQVKCLKKRIDDLEVVETQYKELVESSKDLERIKAEREQLKHKIKELMQANYNKQREVCEMEDELRKLIAQIDRMTQEECNCVSYEILYF